jgi:hypothetical protein
MQPTLCQPLLPRKNIGMPYCISNFSALALEPFTDHLVWSHPRAPRERLAEASQRDRAPEDDEGCAGRGCWGDEDDGVGGGERCRD